MKKESSISGINAAIILGSMLVATFIVLYKPEVEKPREKIRCMALNDAFGVNNSGPIFAER